MMTSVSSEHRHAILMGNTSRQFKKNKKVCLI